MKSFRHDKLNIIDLEGTCWEEKVPESRRSDIIQVGWCQLKLDDLEIINRGSIYVKPTRSLVSPYCTYLTGITQSQAFNGLPYLKLKAHLMKKIGAQSRGWASWSEGDRTFIDEHNEFYGCESPLSSKYVDLQHYAMLALGLDRAPSVSKALECLGLTFEGKAHHAEIDAYNTARVAQALFRIMRGSND